MGLTQLRHFKLWYGIAAHKEDGKVENGWVTLAGSVDWQYQRVAAESAVRGLSGVVTVENLIDVTPRVAPRDVKQKDSRRLKVER